MKYLSKPGLLLIILAFVAVTSSCNKPQAISPQPSAEQAQSIDEFLKRWEDPKHQNLLQGMSWTLTHDYADFKRMEEVLKTVQIYFEALDKYEKGENAPLEKLGGIKAFKDKSAEWLNDNDQAIRAFAAVLLGISGDKAYAPQLAVLLKERESTNIHLRYDRGRAAAALGLVGAQEYVPDLVSLLNSANEFDRVGAAQGLGFLGAKEQAKAVAKLLNDKDENVREAAKEVLGMMGASELIKDGKAGTVP